jgi:hypothetical protein
MKSFATRLAMVSALLLTVSPASAHRPHFTQVERILLPDGEAGELRLLHGDGIFFADPIRVLALDAQGRLIARSHRSTSMALSCEPDGRCLALDLANDKLLELDPSSFRVGPFVPGLKGEDRDALWKLEDGDENWGFRVSEANLLARVEGNLALARRNPHDVAVYIALGAMTAVLLLSGPGKARLTSIFGVALWLAFALRLAVAAFLILLSIWWAYLGGQTTELWLGSFGFSAGLVLIVAIIVRTGQRRRRGDNPADATART